MFDDFGMLPLVVVGGVILAVALLFGITFGIIKLIERNQRIKRDQSLPPGVSNESEYADFLSEKYKTE